MKLSIIIPVYNVSEFIIECLESLYKQNLRKCEVIIIDDGSTDDSFEKVKDYVKNKKNFFAYKQKNKGQGAARNLGVKLAKGEYIWFIDSDDFVSDCSINKIMDSFFKSDNADILSFNAITVNEKGKKLRKINLNGKYTAENIIKCDDNSILLPSISWNKVIKRKVLIANKISFPEKLFFEDVYFTALIILESKNIFFIDEALYFYRQRNDSTTHSISEKTLDIIKIMNMTIQEFKKREKYLKYNQALEYLMIKSVALEVVENINKVNPNSKLQKQIIKEFKLKFPNALNNSYLTKREKKQLMLIWNEKYRIFYFRYSMFLIIKDRIKQFI